MQKNNIDNKTRNLQHFHSAAS